MYPFGQEQTGLWFITVQIASVPQLPGHGSIHFWLTQAWRSGHELLVTQPGLHSDKGFPKKFAMHVQMASVPDAVHLAFIPHGFGVQGRLAIGGITVLKKLLLVYRL